MRHDFASDTTAGVCPESWAALAEANCGSAPSYGDDAWTARATALVREVFETECDVFFVSTGTAANALALAALGRPYHAVICHDVAHVAHDECGAPGFFSGGGRLLMVGGANGKLDPALVEPCITERLPVHESLPVAVTLTQATECATVYQRDEVAALAEVARRHSLAVHMDGARFANAVASLNLPPRALTWEAGVDVLSFGGTKNGLGIGDAIVFFRRELAEHFDYRRKQAGQLTSKMRYLAAPWTGGLRDGVWLRNAAHANAMARLLADRLLEISGVRLAFPVEANGVFVILPAQVASAVAARGWMIYQLFGESYRLMCSWATTEAIINEFIADARSGLD